jgi:hypothetical protein
MSSRNTCLLPRPTLRCDREHQGRADDKLPLGHANKEPSQGRADK